MACTSLHRGFCIQFPSESSKTIVSSPSNLSFHPVSSVYVSRTAKNGAGSSLNHFSPVFFYGNRRDGSARKSTQKAFSFASSPAGDLRPAIDENPEGILSGEWPENFSLLSYDDLRAYLETMVISKKMKPTALLGEVMSTPVRMATADQTLEEIDHNFEVVSGLPVIDAELRCIGVISKKDKAKASNGLKSTVGEVMSSPAITLLPDKTVLEAAAFMLKKKIHRIPIQNEQQQLVGIVTRTDIFQALETKEG